MRLLDTRALARALGVPPADAEAAARAEVGRLAGPYRLLDLVGVGGTGAVYRARRESTGETVALKLVRGADGETGRRVRREAACVRRLDHPSIVKLVDEGEEYLAFEFVEGTPIDRHCDDRELRLSERLDLFVLVCEAIEHAHRRGVVHRDLKPAHVLVDGAGRPRIVDFGIAHAGGGGADSRTLLRAMTPLYASPEQMRGDRPTAASDVFALGVLLHDLVADERGRASNGLARVIARATEPDPARRYGSARALARDVARFRAGKRPRARRPLRPARTAAAALALVAAAAAGSLAARRASLPPVAAAPPPSRAAALLREVFESASPSRLGGDVDALYLLADVGLRIDPEVAPTEPTEAAGLHETVGRTFLEQRLPWAATYHFDRARLLRLERGEDLVVAHEGLGLALALEDRADGLECRRDALARRLARGDAELAVARSRVGLAVALVRCATPPLCAEADRELDLAGSAADAETALEAAAWRAETARHRGDDAARVLDLADRALARARGHIGDDHPAAIDALVTRGRALGDLGRAEEAEAALRRAVDLARNKFGDVGAAARMIDLARVETSRGEVAGAERLLLDALAIRAASYASKEKPASRLLASIRGRLASPDRAVALGAVDDALSVVGPLRGNPPFDMAGWQSTLLAIGEVLARTPDSAALGERLVREVIDRRRCQYGDDHWRVAEARCRLAQERDAALATLRAALGDGHPAVRQAEALP